MFFLYSSHKTEDLSNYLSSVIKANPLASIFEKEMFLVQNFGMEKWLSQQLADQFKIWGNYQFQTLDIVFNTVAQKTNINLTAAVINSDTMVWRIDSLLRASITNPDLDCVKQYLASGNTPLKRYQLACKLAHLFSQYQLFRPELLTAWQHNQLRYNTDTERWQKTIWLALAASNQQYSIPFQAEVINTLNAIPIGALPVFLPKRIFIFGINHLAPVMLNFLHALARHTHLHFFLLNTIADIAPQSEQVLQTQHPLLSRLGQQGYDFQQMMLARGLFNQHIKNTITPVSPKTILEQLQYDILTNHNTSQRLSNDGSISVHACHSRMREVDVIKNQLLNVLEHNAELELRDIIVMAPNIQDYAPFISAVFHDIQHTIADYSLLDTHQVFNAFIDFIQLSQSRLGWKSVIDLLERPIMYNSFELTDSDVELIKHWVHDNGVRWGQSTEHRHTLDLFACDDNTWQNLLNRLLMGYAVSDDNEFIVDILPYKNIEGSSAQALGGLHDFLQLLFIAAQQFKQSMPLAQWSTVLYHYAEQLFSAADTLQRKQLNDVLLSLATLPDDSHQDTIEISVISAWLETKVQQRAQQDTQNGFLRGQLTFCSMQPMRVMPFKVIVLLGMNEGDFPHQDIRPSFDLMTQETCCGDSSSRNADRYQFLEIILSARQQLLISYIGQSIMHNNRMAPAIVVSELLDTLCSSYQFVNPVVYHPLHAFSAQYFNNTANLFSYSETDCQSAIALTQPKAETSMWWQGSVTTTEQTTIEFEDMVRFFQHPQRYFMRKQLNIRFNNINAEPEERELFALDNLELYNSLNQGIENQLINKKNSSVKKRQAQGHWPSGVVGELEAQHQDSIINDFVKRINALNIGKKCTALPIDIHISHYRLIGMLPNIYENGSLFYRYSPLKGKDFMVALLHHLVINHVMPQTTYLLSRDENLTLLPQDRQDDVLTAWIALYLEGQQRPDVFFVDAALAYLQQCTSKSGTQSAMDKAIDQLTKTLIQPYEQELRRLYVNTDALSVILDNAFEQFCRDFVLPAWQATQIVKNNN